MNKFTTISTKDYVPLSHKEEYFHNKYELIQSFLEKEFGEDFSNILALPQIKNREVNWHSKHTTVLKRVTNFSKTEQEQILNIYWSKINTIKNLSSSFQNSNSDEKKRWAALLDDVFNSNNNIVYSDGENIVLLWGWKFNASEENYVPPPIISTVNDEDHTISEPIEEENPVPIIPPDPIDDDPIVPKIPWYVLFWEWIKKFFRRFWWILLLLLILWLLLNLDSCSCNQPKDHVEKDDSYIDKNNPINDENTWDDENNTGLEDDEYKKIKDNNQSHDLYDDLLIDEDGDRRDRPKVPDVQIPINDEDLIIDEDSLHYIVPDIINIALKNKNDNYEKFIKDYLSFFPKEKYQIIYESSSKETRRIQIRVPEEERVKMKDTIRRKLNKYDLLIWDETVFQSLSFNEPELKDKNKNYHFRNINMFDAWEKTTGDKDIIIAIIDDGFDLNHDEINDNIVDPWNIINQNNVIYSSNTLAHGTHVAGIAISEKNNNLGVCGIAPDCSFMPIQIGVEGSPYMSATSIIDGLLYAINHDADVINLSLGFPFSDRDSIRFNNPSDIEYKNVLKKGKDLEYFWKEIFKMANEENITIVFAAGNQNVLLGCAPYQRDTSVIWVSAVDKNNRKADFSNHGKGHSTISAPGVDIYSCVPGNKFDSWPGTSMSAPIITGVVALMKSIDPNLTNKEIIDILQETGKPVDRSIGPLVQVDKALKACGGGSVDLSNDSETDNRLIEINNELDNLEKREKELEKEKEELLKEKNN